MLWFCILITSRGCGCFKNKEKTPLKRMFVLPEVRGRGFAQSICGFRTMGSGVRVSFSVLETLDRQTEAIGMYQKCGYCN
jgi:GNAT superfamily N-acetyltransferase